MNYLYHQSNTFLTNSRVYQSAQTPKPNYDVQYKLDNNLSLNKSSAGNMQVSLNSQEETHNSYNCSCLDKNAKDKIIADKWLRKELKLNRSLSSEKIKFEQNCFRFKLKICSILRMIAPQDHQTINNLQNSSPDTFITYCQKNIKEFVKNTKNQLQANQQVIANLTKQLHDKQGQIDRLTLELEYQRKIEEHVKGQKKKQINQMLVLINKKQSTIRRIEDQLFKIEHFSNQQIRNQHISNQQSLGIHTQKKEKGSSQNPQQCKFSPINLNQYISRRQYSQKLITLVHEWRTILHTTVDYYENILESKNRTHQNDT